MLGDSEGLQTSRSLPPLTLQKKNCTCSELQQVCRQGGLLVQQLTLFKKCSKNKYLSKERAVFQGAWPKIYCRTTLLQANLFLKLKSFFFFWSEFLFFLKMRMSCKDLKVLFFSFKSLKAFCVTFLFCPFGEGGTGEKNLRKYSAHPVYFLFRTGLMQWNFFPSKNADEFTTLFGVTQLGSKWKWRVNFMKHFLFNESV